MLRKRPRTSKSPRILSEHGKILLKKTSLKLIECIRSLRLTKKITIRNSARTASKRSGKELFGHRGWRRSLWCAPENWPKKWLISGGSATKRWLTPKEKEKSLTKSRKRGSKRKRRLCFRRNASSIWCLNQKSTPILWQLNSGSLKI